MRSALLYLPGVCSTLIFAPACTRAPPSSAEHAPVAKLDASPAPLVSLEKAVSIDVPSDASRCTAQSGAGPTCFQFGTSEGALRWVLSRDPLILAVGEAHAQKGSERIASSTKRFTEAFLPILAPRATDVVVELWAPDPKCMKEVKQVASAQKSVTSVQAETNQNEYVTLGTKAKEVGMTPWLLRPTCDDFGMLADAGADAVGAMLGLVKRLTQEKVSKLYEKNGREGADPAKRMVITYGGALHNDLSPPEATKEFSFGPELDRTSHGRYVELDLIVPEYVKNTAIWEKLPWYPSFVAEGADGRVRDKATLYVLAERSFVLVFPAATSKTPALNAGAASRAPAE
jgi:hypothetical protein